MPAIIARIAGLQVYAELLYRTVIFFDLDGTLMVNPFETAVWPVIMGEISAKSGASLEAVRRMMVDENAKRQDDESVAPILAMDWDDIADTVARRLGVVLEARTEALVRQYAAEQSVVLDHAHAVLRSLAAPHRALVVATKGLAKYQLPVLDALGLTPLFDSILTPDRYNGLKKHRRFFGDWPERTQLQIMVGDRYDDDVLYPTRHGFKTIWKIPTPDIHLQMKSPVERASAYPYTADQSVHPDAIIVSLGELPPLIEQVEREKFSPMIGS
jgi:FMN phosphatase YigB (HAD superfamily)